MFISFNMIHCLRLYNCRHHCKIQSFDTAEHTLPNILWHCSKFGILMIIDLKLYYQAAPWFWYFLSISQKDKSFWHTILNALPNNIALNLMYWYSFWKLFWHTILNALPNNINSMYWYSLLKHIRAVP